MDMFVIKGGEHLSAGIVAVGGAKNSALPLMAAALAAERRSDPPRRSAFGRRPNAVAVVGNPRHAGDARRPRRNFFAGQYADERPLFADYELVRRMRAGFCVLGPLLAKRGRACVSLPGGCNIGDRPIDLHLKGLQALGAEIHIERGYVDRAGDSLAGCAPVSGRSPGKHRHGNVQRARGGGAGRRDHDDRRRPPANRKSSIWETCSTQWAARINRPGNTVFDGRRRRISYRGVEHTVIPDRARAATLIIAAAGIARPLNADQHLPRAHDGRTWKSCAEIGVRIVAFANSLDGSSRGRAHCGRSTAFAVPVPGAFRPTFKPN